MEADWEVEIGGDAPVIDAGWSGLVDLVRQPERIGEIAEAAAFPPLAACLLCLNGAVSPVWTSKCDFWETLDAGSFDADEMDAASASAACGSGGYIDLLRREASSWQSPDMLVAECRNLCAQLRAVPLRNCRVDLVVRQACFSPDSTGLGITAYVTACGASPTAARISLGRAFESFAATVAEPSNAQNGNSPVQ
jgi:hypothetical protein